MSQGLERERDERERDERERNISIEREMKTSRVSRSSHVSRDLEMNVSSRVRATLTYISLTMHLTMQVISVGRQARDACVNVMHVST